LPLTVTPPLRILAAAASPRDYETLDMARERRNLAQALSGLERAGLVELDWLAATTLDALREQLLGRTYHVFHFIGHGGFDERNQDGLLVFENAAGGSHRVSGERVAVLLGNHRTLRLATLNACEGARTSEQDPFAGTAMTLLRTGNLPAVVAMQFEITDTAAIQFARGFYGAIAAGRPVDAAVAQGRQAIFADDNDVEWSTPVLYSRAADGVIFQVERGGAVGTGELPKAFGETARPAEMPPPAKEPETARAEIAPVETRNEEALPSREQQPSSVPERTYDVTSKTPPPATPERKMGTPREASVRTGATTETSKTQAPRETAGGGAAARAYAKPSETPPVVIQSRGALFALTVAAWGIAFALPSVLGVVTSDFFSGLILILLLGGGLMGILWNLARVPRSLIPLILGGYVLALVATFVIGTVMLDSVKTFWYELLKRMYDTAPDGLVDTLKSALSDGTGGVVFGAIGGGATWWILNRDKESKM
jgi:hypothetical protein